MRATATQLERFNTAVNTFKGKCDCIPGVRNPSQFGLPGIPNTTNVLNDWSGSVADDSHLQDGWGSCRRRDI